MRERFRNYASVARPETMLSLLLQYQAGVYVDDSLPLGVALMIGQDGKAFRLLLQ